MYTLGHLLPAPLDTNSNEARLRREISTITSGFCAFLVPALACTAFLVAPPHLAAALLWAFAALIVSAVVGFLFGIPRVLTTETTSITGEQVKVGGSGYRQHASTSLEQIADWLTKAIVGVALVELKSLSHLLWELARIVGDSLGGAAAWQSAALALLLCFGAAGFLGGYLLTRLYLSSAFGLADQIATLPITETQRAIVSTASIDIQSVPSSGSSTLRESAPAAVRNIIATPFETLTQPEDMAIWAKVQLDEGHILPAVSAYAKAVSLKPSDVRFRFEHAVAMARAGHPAASVVEEMRAAYRLVSGSTPPDLAKRVVTNLVYQCLFLPAPAGFEEAIRTGEAYLQQPDSSLRDGALLVNLACAFGQKTRWLQTQSDVAANAEEITHLTDRAYDALQRAVSLDSRWKDRLRILLSKDDPLELRGDDDDLVIFADMPKFTALYNIPA